MAKNEAGGLPTKEQLQEAGIDGGNHELWMPVRRNDGFANDWA